MNNLYLEPPLIIISSDEEYEFSASCGPTPSPKKSIPFPSRLMGRWAQVSRSVITGHIISKPRLAGYTVIEFQKAENTDLVRTNYMGKGIGEDVRFDGVWQCGERWIPYGESQLQFELSITESDEDKHVIQFFTEGGMLVEVERFAFSTEVKHYLPLGTIPPPTEPIRLSNATFIRAPANSALDIACRPTYRLGHHAGQ